MTIENNPNEYFEYFIMKNEDFYRRTKEDETIIDNQLIKLYKL